MKVVDFTDDEIERIAAGNFDAMLTDLRSETLPPGFTLEKALNANRQADEFDRFFDSFAEELQLIAEGRSAPVTRLRSERTAEPDDDEWHPGDDPEKGLASFGKASGGIRETGEPNSVRKLADGTVLQFDASGHVCGCFPNGSAPELLALIEE